MLPRLKLFFVFFFFSYCFFSFSFFWGEGGKILDLLRKIASKIVVKRRDRREEGLSFGANIWIHCLHSFFFFSSSSLLLLIVGPFFFICSECIMHIFALSLNFIFKHFFLLQKTEKKKKKGIKAVPPLFFFLALTHVVSHVYSMCVFTATLTTVKDLFPFEKKKKKK